MVAAAPPLWAAVAAARFGIVCEFSKFGVLWWNYGKSGRRISLVFFLEYVN
ncbi:hypothetical protein RchiOBHm_Chr1g0336201 [Rosa chinensis]|uniref:Uncharacterized protein n=1 Tax=Rosa chinensis TaxID=74649 RepID=A0A2P6SCM1_ROSCH|nr:hypothetical protein RchiOBHm_Chr1g0336201 [Rosa chinensis]